MNDAELAAGLAPTPGYRYADVVGNRLLVAGQVPLDEEGELVGRDDPRAQTQQCLRNLATVIATHGFALADIHHVRVHVVGDTPLLGVAWRGVVEFFDGNVPPATLLGAASLGYAGQLVEIEAEIIRA